jgi:outer membrane receptor protein involved in Fe transport
MKRRDSSQLDFNHLNQTPLSRAVNRGLAYGSMVAVSSAFVAAPALAQDNSGELMLEEVIVTAQKRAESMQNVPIAITAFNTEQLEKLDIQSFEDYALMIPNVSFKSFGKPGGATIYMRGLADGGDANPSGSAPSVGLYLDEQPVTTIGSNLDVHIYDIERIEALGGPQGTLFGASSQAGTVRIITNKPDPAAFAAGYDLGGMGTSGGDPSYSGEGFVNVPLGERAALRVVGWYVEEGGWIDNVPGTRTYDLEWGAYNYYDPNAPYGRTKTINNAHLVGDNINELTKTGARAALKVDLNDHWTGTLSLITQDLDSQGIWEYDPNLPGEDKIQRYYADFNNDEFTQLGLTIEGNWDNHRLVYAGAWLDREVDYQTDYTAYGEYASWVPYYACDYSATGADLDTQSNTDCTSLEEFYTEDSTYDRQAHEIRLQSTSDGRFHYTVGLFYEKSEHDYFLKWNQPFMSPTLSVPPFDDLFFRTDQVRTDEQTALFGELTYDFTDSVSGTFGMRYFDEDHTVTGVVGWGPGIFGCPPYTSECIPTYRDTNADSSVSNDDTIFKANLTWQLSDNRMIYFTWSEGYRPGGLNRDPGLPSQPWVPDFVTNYEFGWKITSEDGRLRFNGATYFMDWEDIQYTVYNFSLSACCGNVYNLSTAEVFGVEADLTYLVSENWTMSAAVAYNDGETTADFELPNGLLSVPSGTTLPNVPEFKGNIFARYDFDIGDLPAFAQLTWSYTGSSYSEIVPASRFHQASYSLANLRGGINKGNWGVDLFVNNLTDEVAQFYVKPRNYEPTVVTNRPRSYGLKFWQRF